METVGWLVGTDTAKQLDVEVLQKNSFIVVSSSLMKGQWLCHNEQSLSFQHQNYTFRSRQRCKRLNIEKIIHPPGHTMFETNNGKFYWIKH